jgi:hypothetical protein
MLVIKSGNTVTPLSEIAWRLEKIIMLLVEHRHGRKPDLHHTSPVQNNFQGQTGPHLWQEGRKMGCRKA